MLIVPPSGGEQFIGSTFAEQPSGLVVLLDPLTGEQLEPTVVPGILRSWPVLGEGYRFLEEYGESIDFTLLLTTHTRGEDVADAGIDLRAEARRLQALGGILFMEGLHHAQDAGELSHIFNDVSRGSAEPSEHRAKLLRPDDSFMADLLDLVYNTGVRIENADLRRGEATKDMDLLGPVHALLDQWYNAIDMVGTRPTTPENSKQLLAVESGFHNYREWMIAGIMGAKLSRFKGKLPPIAGSLLIGSGHANMGPKLSILLGHPIRVEGTSAIPSHDRYAAHILRGVGRAALTARDMRDFHELRLGHTGPSFFAT